MTMPSPLLRFDGVICRFGSVTAVGGIGAGVSCDIAAGSFVALLRLDSIIAAEVTSEEGQEMQDAIRQNLYSSIAEDMAALFTATVGQQAGIALDQAVIDAVNTQLGN